MAPEKENNSVRTDRALTITRLLNAPRETVWQVFTQPDQIKNWWGPDGFSNSIETMEVKPGGTWKFVMHGPDGRDYENINRFVEVVPPARIVYEHVNYPNHTTTITFEEQDGKTLLTWHMQFESAEMLDTVVKTFKADEGLKQNIGKLEKHLAAYKA